MSVNDGDILPLKVIEYFTCSQKEHWLDEIRKCDWGAGQYLCELIEQNRLKKLVGENALVLLLTRGDELISFCTFAALDDVQPTELRDWIGFVYTFPQYRGHGYAGELLAYAEALATVMGREYIHISTNHVGFYEKYGYEFFRMDTDVSGDSTRVYRKALQLDGAQKDERFARGSVYKAEIVENAKKETDALAFCGFSCSHCFLGQWCGGCRSSFNCCSYATLFEGGRCPNSVCCEQSGLNGCYECDMLEDCTKGFYTPDNDGSNACKAQAIFVKRHGKDCFFAVHDKLHEKYDFKKTQEILGTSVEQGLELLEKTLNEVKNENYMRT